ncbi:MAG: ATP-binding cassette domain-containing protein [Prevotella sp.]
MLELKNVAISHNGKRLVEDLSFVAADGKVTVISGPSGCGKTTLLRAMMGFHPVDKGFISIDGELVTALSAPVFRQSMAYVPQDISFPINTVKELTRLPFTLKANSTQAFSQERVMEQWHQLGLDSSLYEKRTSEVSGGERQRIMLATLGILSKRIVIVDEPTSALDHLASNLVGEYLQRLAQKGATVIAVSHDPNLECDKRIEL